MNVSFRVDSSLRIGSGHLMRCLTLANEISKSNANVSFISCNHEGNLNNMVREAGFYLYEISSRKVEGQPKLNGYEAWLGHTWLDDAQQVNVALTEQKCHLLFVDHYALDSRWEHLVGVNCDKLVVIDDLANRHHDCDMLIDQTCGRQRGAYKQYIDEQTVCLLGSDYTILRPEFRTFRTDSLQKRASPTYQKLLISLGGVDNENVTAQVLCALKKCQLTSTTEVIVVLGENAPHRQHVSDLLLDMPFKASLLVGVTNMAKLMMDCDYAIGAAGSSAWERSCLGLPTILIVTAENQLEVAKSLQDRGAAIVLSGSIEPALIQLFQEPIYEWLGTVAKNASKLIDGDGCSRIVNQLEVEGWLNI